MDYVESVGFGHLHIFAYSPRVGTKAAELPDQVSQEVRKGRSREMHALGRRMKRQTFEGFLGRRLPVLIEGRFGGEAAGDWFGYTPNYLPVRVAASAAEDPVNKIALVSLRGIHPDGESLIAGI